MCPNIYIISLLQEMFCFFRQITYNWTHDIVSEFSQAGFRPVLFEGDTGSQKYDNGLEKNVYLEKSRLGGQQNQFMMKPRYHRPQ